MKRRRHADDDEDNDGDGDGSSDSVDRNGDSDNYDSNNTEWWFENATFGSKTQLAGSPLLALSPSRSSVAR
jgi:hypothetical protein